VLVMTATGCRRLPISSVLIDRSSSRTRRPLFVPYFYGGVVVTKR